MQRKASETDREYLERRLIAERKKNSIGDWFTVVIIVGLGLLARSESPRAQFPTGGMYPTAILGVLIFAAMNWFSHYQAKMLSRRLDRMPVNTPETPGQHGQRLILTREQLVSEIKTQNNKILVGASVTVIYIVAATYIAVYRVAKYEWVAWLGLAVVPIGLLTIVYLWSERREFVRLYNNDGNWVSNVYIVSSDDRKHFLGNALAAAKRSVWILSGVITLLIGAAAYLKWLIPHQYAFALQGLGPIFIGLSLFLAFLCYGYYGMIRRLSKKLENLADDADEE